MRVQLATLAASLIATMLIPYVSVGQPFPVDSTKRLQPQDVTVETVDYQGRKAVRVMTTAASDAPWAAQKTGEGGAGS
jgi:hypothetical protein